MYGHAHANNGALERATMCGQLFVAALGYFIIVADWHIPSVYTVQLT